MPSAGKEQQHPQEKSDRAVVDRLLQSQPDKPYNLAELARLRIRYRGFPGAKEIQTDLDRIMQQWQLTEEQLFEQTRQIHDRGSVYRERNNQDDREDWS
jgi:hypothetical protein